MTDDAAARARPGRSALRGRAGGRALALPRHGHRPRPARRAARRHRLDLDADDALQPQPAASSPSGRPRRWTEAGGVAARVQHDRRVGQPVAGHARDARVAGLARGDRRLDRADGRTRTTSTRSSASSAATRPCPAALMALARVDRPGRRAVRRADAGGPLAGRARDDPGRLGGGRRAGARACSRARSSTTLERAACPGAGYCAGNFTANTMAIAIDLLGLGDPRRRADPRRRRGREGRRGRTGRGARRRAARAARDRAGVPRPPGARERHGRRRRERWLDQRVPAPAGDRPRGGVPLSLDELAAISARTPVLADLVPGGRWVAEDLTARAGLPRSPRELIRGGTSTARPRPSRAGRSPGAAGRARAGRRGDRAPSFGARGKLYALRGNLAPDGPCSSWPASSARAHTGPARVFDDEESCAQAVRAG